jgi:site-specific recombinase XerD
MEKLYVAQREVSSSNRLLENGFNNRTDQELLGHRNLQTTMIYIHVARKNVLGV